ncbi:MAG: PilZ domain-containing protein [Bdellovibrionia bacterium]
MSNFQNENIFKRISSPQEIGTLISSFLPAKVELVCKIGKDTVFKTALYYADNSYMKGKLQSDIIANHTQGEVIGTFALNADKFYFVSKFQIKKSEQAVVIETPRVFFQLQRRQHYRLKIPDSYNANVILKIANQDMKDISGHISDLSVGGCRCLFDIQNLIFKLDDDLTGTIQVQGREPIAFKGAIKYIQGNTVGIEFTPFTPALESRVFALTMDLHKEFFSLLK